MSNGNKKKKKKKKKHRFCRANVINISAKFQLYPPDGFWGDDFFFKFKLSIAMATNHQGNISSEAIRWISWNFAEMFIA